MTKKMDSFISILTKKTQEDSIEWDVEGDKVFSFSAENASVYVGQAEDGEHGIRVTTLNVYSAEGKLVDKKQEIEQIDLPENTKLEYLYGEARRSAYKADNVLDSVMDELKKNTK